MAPSSLDVQSRLRNVLSSFVDPALSLLPARMDSPQARVMMLAIGLQESRFLHTHQIGGPAHGYYQFERGGGVRGVLRHASSRDHAIKLCAARSVATDAVSAFDAIEHDQVLASGFARLLLWTDPKPLPAIGDAQGAWDLYIRTWQPGKPHRKTWDDLYRQAVQAVQT